MVAAVARLRVGHGRGIVDGASDGLRKRWENGALGGGLECCSLLKSERWPLGELGGSEGGERGGGEGALGGRGESLAEEAGPECRCHRERAVAVAAVVW